MTKAELIAKAAAEAGITKAAAAAAINLSFFFVISSIFYIIKAHHDKMDINTPDMLTSSNGAS